MSKQSIFSSVSGMLSALKFSIVSKDDLRPWGGFLVIDEKQAKKFVKHFFPEEKIESLKIAGKLSPKILIVAPHKRLSWQFHNRRAEIWKCIQGTVNVLTSETDEEKIRHTLNTGDIIKLPKGERHRLIGLDDWGIVAEIWQHTDKNNPSDEDDIIRVSDDFGR